MTAATRYLCGTSSRENANPVKGPGNLEVPVAFGNFSASTPQGTDFGYFGGGFPGPKSTVDRVDYSNDTATASPKGPLSAVKRYIAATGNQNFGYFSGGLPGPLSTIDRIHYFNDTVDALPRSQLTTARESHDNRQC